jgi:non-ribosomal peptide synthetase component F
MPRRTPNPPPSSRWNHDKVVHRIFADQAAATPAAVAVVADDQALTYGDVNLRANRLAHSLRALGVARGTLVGLCLDRCLAAIAYLSILEAGGAYVLVLISSPWFFLISYCAHSVWSCRFKKRSHLPTRNLPPTGTECALTIVRTPTLRRQLFDLVTHRHRVRAEASAATFSTWRHYSNLTYGSSPSAIGDTLATRVSYKPNPRGPAVTIPNTCSPSLVAIFQARQNLVRLRLLEKSTWIQPVSQTLLH